MEAGALAFPLLIGLVLIALAFDFLNGMNDAANSIATVVSTRVLSPYYAVGMAAFFNFVAFLVFGLHVAETVGRGIVDANVIDEGVIFGALAGAIIWQIITNRLGIPSSSSHALIGGLVGAGLAKAGISAVVWQGVFKTVGGILLAPGLGCLIALFLMLAVSWGFRRFTPYGVDHIFRRAQLVSASCYALGHGGNDAQKTMGIIAVLLYSQGYLGSEFYVPFWLSLLARLRSRSGRSPAVGALCIQWASRITRLTPMQGFCAETGGSIMLFAATELGIPVSTTHTITGSIIGVGAAKKVSAVRWGVAKEIVTAWIITIPAAGGCWPRLFYLVSRLLLSAVVSRDQAATRARKPSTSLRSSLAAASTACEAVSTLSAECARLRRGS